MVEFQVEPAAAVRKYLAELLADAAAAALRPPILAPQRSQLRPRRPATLKARQKDAC